MNILLTGASSFTGAWFAHELVRIGHDVTAIFTSPHNSYTNIRQNRIIQLLHGCTCIFNAPFGSSCFLNILDRKFDILCHHGACTTDYKSDDFDYISAAAKNSLNIRMVLKTMLKFGLKRIILTGSVFEANEGIGDCPRYAFSPYGLSKTLTSEIFSFWCSRMGIPLGKFVIPNPFGPYEDQRFTYYLMQTWVKNEAALVKNPNYIRDNIHILLLAKMYVKFINDVADKYHPSGYIESQGSFTHRFAEAMRERLCLPCDFILHEQNEFNEPRMRINNDYYNKKMFDWDENKAWDDLADYYRKLLIS
jgi:NAD dependent epimerase/dehydratase family.